MSMNFRDFNILDILVISPTKLLSAQLSDWLEEDMKLNFNLVFLEILGGGGLKMHNFLKK